MAETLCPFCKSSIHPEAVICPHCRSHVGLVNPLIARLETLETEVQALQQRLGLPASGTSSSAASSGGASSSNQLEAVEQTQPEFESMSLQRQFSATFSAVFCIWALQALTLFIYDLPPVVLRVAALLTPMAISGLFYRRRAFEVGSCMAFGISVAIISVVLMLALTSKVDAVPMWPESVRDWRELIEFTVAIGLGYLTGALFARSIDARQRQKSEPSIIVLMLTRNDKGRYNIEALAERLNSLVRTASPLATGAMSLYAGLKALIGDP